MLGGIFVLVVGGFVLWLQAGLLYAIGTLAFGGYGLQSNLTAAADGVQTGEYSDAQAKFEAAGISTEQMNRSVGLPQLNVVGRLPGVAVAVANWRRAVSAAANVTSSTGELLSLYGDNLYIILRGSVTVKISKVIVF